MPCSSWSPFLQVQHQHKQNCVGEESHQYSHNAVAATQKQSDKTLHRYRPSDSSALCRVLRCHFRTTSLKGRCRFINIAHSFANNRNPPTNSATHRERFPLLPLWCSDGWKPEYDASAFLSILMFVGPHYKNSASTERTLRELAPKQHTAIEFR